MRMAFNQACDGGLRYRRKSGLNGWADDIPLTHN